MELTDNPGGQASFKGFCDHCNNDTFQTIIAAEPSRAGKMEITYTMSKCTICQGVTLRKHPGNLTVEIKPGSVAQPRDLTSIQLWPPSVTFSSDVPSRVQAIYSEARHVQRKSPSSFVVQLRRAFEAIAKDKKAEGRNLNAQIQWLIDQNQLPNVFAGMMHIARMIGNAGAHDAEEVTFQDVEVADSFFKAIIEYLYVAPALLAEAQAARAKQNRGE